MKVLSACATLIDAGILVDYLYGPYPTAAATEHAVRDDNNEYRQA